MKFPAALARRLHWLNLPGALLIALLQRTPLLRVAAAADDLVFASPVGTVLRSALALAGSLGVMHAQAGATQFVQSPVNPVAGTVGQPLSVSFTINNSPTPPTYFTTTDPLPPGLAFIPAPQGNNVLARAPVIAGTPTQPGIFVVNVKGSDGTYFLDGTITFNIVANVPAPPSITTQPASQTANANATVAFTVVAIGAPAPTFQWRKDGVTIAGAIGATLTLPNVQPSDAASYSVIVLNSIGVATSNSATLIVSTATFTPSITAQPVSPIAVLGQTVTLTVVATGAPAPTYQWFKEGVLIKNATGASYTIGGVQTIDAGNYFVIVTNSAGSVTSAAATLNVIAVASAPVFTAQPVSQTIASGSTVVFTAAANGSPTPAYQWHRNLTALAGATSATLVIPNATAADAGNYTCAATNVINSATSNAVTLVLFTTPDVGRLINLSVLTDISAAVSGFTVGTVVGGAGTSGTKGLVVRAAGPSLGALGVPGTLADPKLDLFVGQTVVATNDNWGGDPTLLAAMASVGAFAYTSAASKDAAVFNPAFASGSYTVQVSGVGGSTGTVIAEIYDATPAGTYTLSTPRLVNVSVLKQINVGGSLTLGFTIGGSTAKTVLIRAIGPALGLPPFSIGGVMADPQVTLFNSHSVAIGSNNDWGGDPQLSSAGSRVGAFAIGNTQSKDAMLLVTLPAGGYTATASGVNNTGGLVIVEVYEVP
jgi:hypothetical protein